MNTSILIKDGTIIDGSGSPAFHGDIRCRDGKIVEISAGLRPLDEMVIQAKGLVVAPGFIDAHCHTDMYAAYCPNARGKIMQGVTTDICGLCGDSPAPVGSGNLKAFQENREYQLPDFPSLDVCSFSDYKSHLNSLGNATNMALFVGNSNLRIHAVGYENRPPHYSELNEMKGLLRESMEAGAYGLSTGLTYAPSMFASTNELLELSRVIAPFNGMFNAHMRSEGHHVLQAIEEVIHITEHSGCRGHISHLKVSGIANHGRAQECLELIHRANERGIPITFDVHPYTAGSFGLKTLLPPDVLAIGIKEGYDKLNNPVTFDVLCKRLKDNDWDNTILNCGPENIIISALPDGPHEYEGKTLLEISSLLRMDIPEALIWLLASSGGQGSIVFFAISEDDLVQFISDPFCTIGTDSFARDYEGPTAAGKPHPRNYGAFPRYIRRFILQKKLFSLESGIRKMTGLTAKHFQIPNRGLLKPGYEADITIFDASEIDECGTFADPVKYPKGIRYVIISGKVVAINQEFLGIRAGRIISRSF